jgi:hypothetical protein
MKNIWLIMAIFLLAISGAHGAAALSTEYRNNQNNDGTPRFADPDEQKPGFMVAPDNVGNENVAPSSGFSGVTLPAAGDVTSGAEAFDRTFSQQQGGE